MYVWIRWTDVTFILVVILAFAFAFTKCVRHRAARAGKKNQRMRTAEVRRDRYGRELNGSAAILSPKDMWE
jgi:hypothetical protein